MDPTETEKIVADTDTDLIALTADIVSAHVSHNNVSTADLPGLIQSVHDALAKTSAPPEPEVRAQEPAVAIRSSVKQDYIVCLEDGAKLKMLKRYLRTRFNLSPEEYRTKWGLPRDYPMVAPAYAETRRTLAKSIGLGRKPGQTIAKTVAPIATAVKRGAKAAVAKVEEAVTPAAPAKRGRKPKSMAEAQTAAKKHLSGSSATPTKA
jgi:predicted transcriptional regulator